MNIQGLIEQVMANLRKKHGDDRVYTDEKILRPASQMASYLPEEYARMKELAQQGTWNTSEEELFYRQGMLMEKQEDACPYNGQFLRYRPTYRVLTDAQLRGYFTWRADVRRGNVRKTAQSFTYIYLYELLCHIGVHTAEEAYDALKAFAAAYARYDGSLMLYAHRWLKDLWIYDQPQREAPILKDSYETEERIARLCEPFSQTDEGLYETIDLLTGGYISRSRFAKEYRQDVCKVVCGVYRSLYTHHEKHCKTSLPEKLFGRARRVPYPMFGTAVFYRPVPRADCEVEWSPLVRYICQNGEWWEHRLCDRVTQCAELTRIVKRIDAVMRDAYRYKYPLKETDATKLLTRMIESEIARVQEENRAAARAVIDIDVSQLDGIRRAADKTRDSLLVEEEETVSLAEPEPEPTSEALPQELPLSEAEYGFLRCLLTGGDGVAFARERRLMPSVLADAINESLYERFSDTVLDCTGDRYEVIADYESELKEMLNL